MTSPFLPKYHQKLVTPSAFTYICKNPAQAFICEPATVGGNYEMRGKFQVHISVKQWYNLIASPAEDIAR